MAVKVYSVFLLTWKGRTIQRIQQAGRGIPRNCFVESKGSASSSVAIIYHNMAFNVLDTSEWHLHC